MQRGSWLGGKGGGRSLAVYNARPKPISECKRMSVSGDWRGPPTFSPRLPFSRTAFFAHSHSDAAAIHNSATSRASLLLIQENQPAVAAPHFSFIHPIEEEQMQCSPRRGHRRQRPSLTSPLSRFHASPYRSCVPRTTSSAMVHPLPSGPFSSPFLNPFAVNQSRTYCLSKLGCARPLSYFSLGQNRDESGVSTSSASSTSAGVPSSSVNLGVAEPEEVEEELGAEGINPNSNFVSARMTPFDSAYAAAVV
jgi:hypothetical protein